MWYEPLGEIGALLTGFAAMLGSMAFFKKTCSQILLNQNSQVLVNGVAVSESLLLRGARA